MRKAPSITQTVQAFLRGEIVIFPTDTVWGVGCSLSFPESIKRLYHIKARPLGQPTAILVSDLEKAKKLGKFSSPVEKIASKVWPGAVTLIVPASSLVPKAVLGSGKTVGLRIPNHDWLLQVLKKLSLGIVATSANFAQEPAPLKKTMLDPNLIRLVDTIVEGVRAGSKSASTVVDTTVSPVKILRVGTMSVKFIKNLFH